MTDSSTDALIPPPVDTSWTNDEQAVADAAAILRLPLPDERLEQCAAAAGSLICLYLDRRDPIPGSAAAVPPEPLRHAHAHVTVELYRRKDAPFGVLNAWSPDEAAVRIGNDPLAGVRPIIDPYKARWGIG